MIRTAGLPAGSGKIAVGLIAAAGLMLGQPAAGQTAAAQTKPPAKVQARAPAKAPANKALPPPTTAAQRAELPEADEAQKSASELVHYGKYVCDDKYEIFVEKNTASPAYVDVRYQKSVWVMKPVSSATGAVRLEDTKGATLLVQIPYKSMLLNTKTGQRIVDSCKSGEQIQAFKDDEAAKASAPTATADSK